MSSISDDTKRLFPESCASLDSLQRSKIMMLTIEKVLDQFVDIIFSNDPRACPRQESPRQENPRQEEEQSFGNEEEVVKKTKVTECLFLLTTGLLLKECIDAIHYFCT